MEYFYRDISLKKQYNHAYSEAKLTLMLEGSLQPASQRFKGAS